MRLVYGVGINDVVGAYKTKEYRIWVAMLKRCYSSDYQKSQPSYIGCEVSEDFKILSVFSKWCRSQPCFFDSDANLDKDILIKGNKIYSMDTCCFVPREINCLFERCGATRGEHPIGVYFDIYHQCFRAHMRKDGKFISFGKFPTLESAFMKYKTEKEKYIKSIAHKHKDRIRGDIYNAMMSYSVSILD